MALKIKLKRVSGVPTTSDLESGEVAINTSNNQIYANLSGTVVAISGASQSIDLSAVDQDIVPDGNGTRDLGSPTKRWAELYLSGNTIDLGGAIIDSDGTGQVSVSATGVTLPVGSKTDTGNEIAVVSTGSSGGSGQVTRLVNFFSKAGGLSTPNTRFEFNATVDNRFVFTGSKSFTLANGTSLTDSEVTLFQF